MGRNILKSSVENASFSIVFQILFRCITFILNAFIIRHVGQDVLGIMNVRLLLLESTILFLSREPLLKACLTNTKAHNWAQVINQIWLSVPISAVLSLILVYTWMNILSPTEDKYLSQYYIGCYAIAFSCIVDQSMQSVVLVAQSYCFVRLKVILETFYILLRTAIFVILVLKYPNYAINAFSIAQVFSAVALFTMYYGFFYWYIHTFNKIKNDKKLNEAKELLNDHDNKITDNIFKDMQDFKFTSIMDFFPGYMKNSDKALNKELCILTVSFAKQCIVKQVLTEGERYVMTISPVLTFSEQSQYDIVNNLGSLAARFIFRPIEDSGYFYFTQMIKRDESIKDQDQKSVTEAATVLSQLCKVVTSIGLIVVMFGYTYSHTLLYLYGGNTLISSDLPTTLLKCHCIAVLLLAVNGVTECYVFATMNNKQLDRYNYLMVFFSISFLVISYALTIYIGPVGFIFANCINMAARILHSIYFINNKYKETEHCPLNGLKPDVKFLIVLLISGIFTKVSENYYLTEISITTVFRHILIGGIFFLITAAVWAYENRNLLKMGIDKYKRRVSLKID